MTEKELNQLFYLNKEYERIQKDILNKKQKLGYKSPRITDMPRSGEARNYADDIAEMVDLEAYQNINLRQIQRERARLEEYIGSIEDAEMRLIFRLRCVNCMDWHEIGAELHLERTTVAKKYRKYINLSHNSR